MTAKQQWAWFLLVLVCALTFAWTRRYDYAACDTDGCVAINRWSGSIHFREAEWSGVPEPETQVAVEAVGSARGRAGY
jgi:hypothetical protein